MGVEPPVIRVDHLSKHFGNVAALSDLSLDVAAGEVVGLLGPNGAGKTTTLKLLLGMLRPTAGSCSVLGHDCTASPNDVKRVLGYTPDEPAFYDFLTGRETIEFVASVRGHDAAEALASLSPTVELLELTAALDELTSGYSHGMKKKLAIVLALLHRPRVLLLDEPTNGLDPPSAAKVRELLRRLSSGGVAVLVSTHLLDMAERLCPRVVMLHRGRLVHDGSVAALRERAGVAAGASLEDAFLSITAASP